MNPNDLFPSSVLDRSTTDFNKVRDGRRASAFYLDVNLSVSRSRTGTGANAALMINCAGNVAYVDKNPLFAGAATLHFQDQTTTGQSSTPFYAELGFIARIPFTQLMIENAAQPGKVFRLIYGTDLDFQPGTSSMVSVVGVVSTNPDSYSGSYSSAGALAANTPDLVFSAAANVNGAVIQSAYGIESNASAPNAVFIAKATAPVSNIDGAVIAGPGGLAITAGTQVNAIALPRPVRIPAGLGLYYIAPTATGGAGTFRSCTYTLL